MLHPKKSAPKAEASTPVIDPKAARSFLDQKRREEDNQAFKQISLKISLDLLERCDSAAQLASVTRSSFIKMAVLEKLEREGR